MDEFSELKKVFESVESSWHALDDERFNNFLSLVKTRGSGESLTLGGFRGAFEKAWPGREIDDDTEKRIQELFKKYMNK